MMRRLKWILIASWLGAHALLWAALPPDPFALNGHVPCILRSNNSLSYGTPYSHPYARSDLVSKPFDNFAFAAGNPQLVAGDATSVHIYEPATHQVKTTWNVGVTGRFPGNGVQVLGVSVDGANAVVENGGGAPWLLNLVSGIQTELPGDWGGTSRTIFAVDPQVRLSHSERVLFLDGFSVSIVDPEIGVRRKLPLASDGKVLAVSRDGWTAAVGVSHDFSGSHFSGELRLGLELIDIPADTKVFLDNLNHEGWWLSCHISPDGRTVAGSVTVELPRKPGTQTVNEFPRLMCWDITTRKRLRTVDHAWGCGWCADGRLVVRQEDGECYFASANLCRLDTVPIPSPLTDMDDLSTDVSGTRLIVKSVRPIGQPLRFIKNWLKPGSGDSLYATWKCYDLDGRKLAEVPGWAGGCSISADGKYFAVGSPDGNEVDVYDLPQRKPGGIVLGLMIAQVTLAIVWTALRRRWFQRHAKIPTR